MLTSIDIIGTKTALQMSTIRVRIELWCNNKEKIVFSHRFPTKLVTGALLQSQDPAYAKLFFDGRLFKIVLNFSTSLRLDIPGWLLVKIVVFFYNPLLLFGTVRSNFICELADSFFRRISQSDSSSI